MATKKKVSVANKIYTDFDYKASVDFIKNQVGDRKTILDTNCRNGTLLSLLQKEGFTVSGLAKSRKFKKVIEEQVDCPIKNKSILKYKGDGKRRIFIF